MKCELLTFEDGPSNFALPLSSVSEIAHLRRVIALPFTQQAILGLTNLRGVMVPICSPHILMNRRGRHPAHAEYGVICESQGMTIALACQRVLGVKNVDPIEPSTQEVATKLKIDGDRLTVLSSVALIQQLQDSIMDDRLCGGPIRGHA